MYVSRASTPNTLNPLGPLPNGYNNPGPGNHVHAGKPREVELRSIAVNQPPSGVTTPRAAATGSLQQRMSKAAEAQMVPAAQGAARADPQSALARRSAAAAARPSWA